MNGFIYGSVGPVAVLAAATNQNKHATKHHRTKHPIIEAYDPPEGWGRVLCGTK